MILIDTFALQKFLLSLSLISFSANTFTTSYNTIKTVIEEIKKASVVEDSEEDSEEYKKLNNIKVLEVLKRNRIYNFIVALLIIINLFSVFIKPVFAEDYSLVISSNKPIISIIKISPIKDQGSNKSSTYNAGNATEEIDIHCISIYIACVSVTTVLSFIFFSLLIFSMLRVQRIQLNLIGLIRKNM